MILNWQTSKDDFELIDATVTRAFNDYSEQLYMAQISRMTTMMDLIACHNHACPLDLEALSMACTFDFTHDVFGIISHIDRDTGQLTRSFVPRYAAQHRRLDAVS
jgi:hypothetical protein